MERVYIYIGLGWPALLGKLNQINTSIFYSPFPKKSRIHVADRFLFKMYSFMYRFSCLIMLVRISPVFPRGSYIVYFSLMHFLASEGSYSLLLAKRVEERKKRERGGSNRNNSHVIIYGSKDRGFLQHVGMAVQYAKLLFWFSFSNRSRSVETHLFERNGGARSLRGAGSELGKLKILTSSFNYLHIK